MKLNEAEMRMAYQLEATSQNAALNEIYMTWRYTQNRETKATAESLLAKLRPLSDKECMDVIREVQANYHLLVNEALFSIFSKQRTDYLSSFSTPIALQLQSAFIIAHVVKCYIELMVL